MRFRVLEQAPSFRHCSAQHSAFKMIRSRDLLCPLLHQSIDIHVSFDAQLFGLVLYVGFRLSFGQLLLVTGLGSLYSLQLLLRVRRHPVHGLLLGKLFCFSLVLDSLMRQDSVLHLFGNVHVHFVLFQQVFLFVKLRFGGLRPLE